MEDFIEINLNPSLVTSKSPFQKEDYFGENAYGEKVKLLTHKKDKKRFYVKLSDVTDTNNKSIVE